MKLGQKLAIGFIRAKLNLAGVISPKWAGSMAFKLFCTPFRKSRKKQPKIFRKAVPVSFRFGTYSIKGYQWNSSAPKKILIVHGFESTCYNFDRYVSPLLKQGLGVVAFDAPAHGASSGKRVNVLIYRDFLAEVAGKYGPFYGVLAHSFGGLATALWQEQASVALERIVLIAPATETATAVNSFISFLQLSPKIRAAFEARLVEMAGKPIAWFSVARAVSHITATILWIHDEEDSITPISDVHPVMAAEIPGIRFMITKGWGHRQIYRENQVVKAATDFLSQ